MSSYFPCRNCPEKQSIHFREDGLVRCNNQSPSVLSSCPLGNMVCIGSLVLVPSMPHIPFSFSEALWDCIHLMALLSRNTG